MLDALLIYVERAFVHGEETTSGMILLYFFCRKGDEATALSKKIFLHLLIQLYEKCAPANPQSSPELQAKFSEVLEEAWKTTKSEERQDSTLLQLKTSLVPVFRKLVECAGLNVYMFVDGLDECTDHGELIDALFSLLGTTSLHLMVSSRPEVIHQVRKPVRYTIEVGAHRTQAEIKKYVITKIKQVKRFKPQMRKIACERIASQSEGSFRYADVILESLNQPKAMMTPFAGE